jgi:putative ABC transport system permease protein
MDKLIQDFKYSIRSLFRQPAFAITAIVTLALGIGATTAMFTVVNAIVLRPLPFPEAERIVAVVNLWTKTGTRATTVSAPDFHDWKAQSRSFEALAYFVGGETSVTLNGTGDYVGVYRVTPGFFETLGARASLGRLFSPDEERPGGSLAVVITDAFWRRQFNGRADAVGSTVKYGDRFFTIVGVVEAPVRYPARADIYAPAWLVPETSSRSGHNYRAIGRLKKDVSVAQAQSDMLAIATRLEEQYPNSNAGKSVVVVPLQDLLVGDTRQTLYVLLAAVGLVLLIACANVANLLLARSTAREREMVVRAAVGAGRARLIQQLLTESAVLALLAGVLGIWLARLGVLALVALAPPDLPRLDEIRVDAAVLGFALAVALAASFIFGLAPALQVSRVQLADGLRQGGKGSSLGARGAWARSAFVVAEVALAVVLVFGAGLLGRSLVALAAVEMGFVPEQLLVLRTVVPVQSFAEAHRATAFYRDLLADLRTLPGVNAVSAVTSLPTAIRSNGGYWIEGGPGPEETGIRSPQALFIVSTPDYFRTLRIPMKTGRDFNDGDRRDAPFVAIVNESLARASFPNQDPVGRRIRCGLDTLEYMTIVGVVADVRTAGPSRPVQPEIYMPYEQHPGPATALNIVARTESPDPLALAETMSRTIRARNPDVPVRVSTMEGTLETASATPRFRTFLLVVFAGVALLLAIAGVYGVMAYTVSQRLSELGVRVALGATPQHIMKLIVGYGARLAALGLVLGLALSLAAGRLLQGLLFNVTPRDPLMLALVTVAVAAATLAACYIPGRRAVAVDPMLALRAE